MRPVFSHAFTKQGLETRLFIALIALALLARLFILFTMPDAPLTDTLYHFTITEYIIQNHALPFQGVPGTGVYDMPVPLFHILTAIPFTVLGIPFSLEAARIFPFIFSFLQLALSYILLRELFPKHWLYGFAFVAVHPLLMIFGALNYLETLASVTVLLCFLLYRRFAETGKSVYLITMPFALAMMAISKESATVFVPVFFFAFLYELWKRKPAAINREWAAKAAYFAIASILLSSAWFLFSYSLTGSLSRSVEGGLFGLAEVQQKAFSAWDIAYSPLHFNDAFWFFLAQAFESNPLGLPVDTIFAVFTLITFPVLLFMLWGMAKGAIAKERYSILLLLCFALTLVLLLSKLPRSSYFHSRVFVPVLPLFGIAFCNAFARIKSADWRRLLAALFALTAIYSVCYASLYALHYNEEFNDHLPLYNFVKSLPDGSTIAIHANKARQIEFISGKGYIKHSEFEATSQQELYSRLKSFGVTHLAETCYKNPWDEGTITKLVEEGKLEEIYSDQCSTLYEVK